MTLKELLDQLLVIKVNGGLVTSMGWERRKCPRLLQSLNFCVTILAMAVNLTETF